MNLIIGGGLPIIPTGQIAKVEWCKDGRVRLVLHSGYILELSPDDISLIKESLDLVEKDE